TVRHVSVILWLLQMPDVREKVLVAREVVINCTFYCSRDPYAKERVTAGYKNIHDSYKKAEGRRDGRIFAK
ncbi:MAG: hypothetical protein ACWGNB_06885, partial [Thiogranum sp.]